MSTATRPPHRRPPAPNAKRPSPARKPASRRGRPPAKPVRAVVPVVGGVLWGVLLAVAVGASSLLTAVVVIPVAVVATASGVRAVEGGKGRPSLLFLVSAAVATVAPLCALGGPVAALAAVVLGVGAVGALVLSGAFASSARPLRGVSRRLLASLAPGIAVTSLVVARHQGSSLALAFVGAVLAFDAGAFFMGHGRTALGGPAGVVFGGLSVVVVAVFVAAVMNPPFSGIRPWVVFAGLAVLAPLGVWCGQFVSGPERLPALRRLDSWTFAAPFWVLAAALYLHR